MSKSSGSPPIVYVDTCVYADLIGKNEMQHKETGEPRWKSAQSVFDAVNDDRVVLAASALVEAEVKCLGDYRAAAQSVLDHVQGWFTASSTIWTDVDRFLAADAANLASVWHQHRAAKKRKLGGADATHLAAAVRLGCDYLLTHDEGFPIGQVVDGVSVIRPEVVWVKTLDDELREHLLAEGDQSRAD